MAFHGCTVRVLTTDANGLNDVLDVETKEDVELEASIKVRYCHRLLRHSVSPTFIRLLPAYMRWADVVHLTAVYSFPTIPTLALAKILNKPLIWSPRGALQRWKGSRRTASKTAWDWICRRVRPQNLILHFTSEEEAVESQERLQGIHAVSIPNGVVIPKEVAVLKVNGVCRLLYLGRLDPKKGVENLLQACHKIKKGKGIVIFTHYCGSRGARLHKEN